MIVSGDSRCGLRLPPGGREFRYCRRCISEDREHGVPMHWRRTHQLPGVVICVHHREFLWRHKIENAHPYLSFATPERSEILGVSPVVEV
ncbi:TniQ family protein [Paraburkholderia terrae]|uniref:TniQ family protein n=1 Tax=Paraburkholderia terrae TaxID=311230 RepID=UPI00386208B8